MRLYEIFVKKKSRMYIRQLYSPKEAGKMIRRFGRKKAALFFGIILVFAAVSMPFFISDLAGVSDPLKSLERNEYGKGSRTASLHVVSEDGYENDIRIGVDERQYTEDELETMSREIDGILWETILGENPGMDNVMYDLTLPSKIKGYPFEITWKSDQPLVLGSNGTIKTDRLKDKDPNDEGFIVELVATLKYGDHTEDRYSNVILRQAGRSDKDQRSDVINGVIDKADKDSRTQSAIILPEEVAGKKIRFYKTSSKQGWIILLIGAASAIIVISSKDRKLKEEADERRKQMQCDHPVILNRYMLYYMAGMNPRAIWYEICRRYEEESKQNRACRRYAYEEMIAARNRMEEGCAELESYDLFAARCDDIRFRSFINFVKQAVITGGRGLNVILYEEMEKARREKLAQVKVSASEAETKLLLPMFMMLAVVLVIVMVPAFMGLNG